MSHSQLPEQDTEGNGHDLPTYEDLATQKGPNSRFGRWKGWVEKRAAERYLGVTEEEIDRRRRRGWGEDLDNQSENVGLAENDDNEASQSLQESFYSLEGIPLDQTHLNLRRFGSRFIPHTMSQIHCLLPILRDRLLLIGHDEGLSVLNLFPSGDPRSSTPRDAVARLIWTGEGVCQIELLEYEDIGNGTPQGVLLFLVASDSESSSSKEHGQSRDLRMYNLASIISLARWATEHDDWKPLELRGPKGWVPQIPVKKHMHQSSLAKNTKFRGTEPSLIDERTNTLGTVPSSAFRKRKSTSMSSTGAWDVVDDLVLRWAVDYVAFANTASRLQNTSVLFFELLKCDAHNGRDSQVFLVIALKTSLLLYESPKGQRAFRFMKEFYTPVSARSLAFVKQQQHTGIRALTETRRMADSNPTDPSGVQMISPPYGGSQLCLFVVFEKKAGMIRLSDSAVGEVEFLGEMNKERHISSPFLMTQFSAESARDSKESKAHWLHPIEVSLPDSEGLASQSFYFITKGLQTHVFPSPLPFPLVDYPPLVTLAWSYPLRSFCCRLYHPSDTAPFVQLVGFGEYGIEAQELQINSLYNKGKQKEELFHSYIDVGDAGFLCRGGLWHNPVQSTSTVRDFEIYNSRSSKEEGIYAWCREGLEDWRVVWIGG